MRKKRRAVSPLSLSAPPGEDNQTCDEDEMPPDSEGDTLGHSMREIRRDEVLSAQQEKDLARRAEQGDRAALDRLVEANMRLLVSIARNADGGKASL